MTDRLPEPMSDVGLAGYVERASASPARAKSIPRDRAHPVGRSGGLATTPSRGVELLARSEVPRRLIDVEEWMVSAIMSRDAPPCVDSVFSDGPRQSASARFEIHRSGYRARLIECLQDDYPVLAETLGADHFESLCSAYIDRHPSTSPNLNAFGRHMAAFCRMGRAGGSNDRQTFVSELAALEWAIVEAIHAEAHHSFDATRLKDLDPEGFGALRFVPNAVALLKFEFPVNAFYQAVRHQSASSIPARAASATAVYRRGLTVWRMDLTPAMTRVLEALFAGLPLGEALSRIGVDETDDAAVREAERSVMVWFREWVSSGFFRECVLAP